MSVIKLCKNGDLRESWWRKKSKKRLKILLFKLNLHRYKIQNSIYFLDSIGHSTKELKEKMVKYNILSADLEFLINHNK